TLRLVAACPESCVVCTRDVTLCHQLTYILAAPMTTRVLIITDGYLSSIESTNLSLLFNLALLSLSRNGIQDVQEDALDGLTMLRTLLLEHNQISSSSLTDHTFSKLHSLQVLVLSNNALRTLQGSWFRNTRGLTRLQLDGNQITNLTDTSFGGTNLHSLRHLDLSNNFISYIGRDAFRPLPQLQEVDLSRNRLAHMPDVFTPLKQLILLSLDKNQWSCTCDLHPLARFLRNYIKSSAHTLRNAKDLNCQPSTTAVAVAKSVLRLSETNCDSKAPNFTLVLKDRSPLLPGQDVALLTLLGFAGAVGLTCLGLVVFNWKLQQGKANEHTSENLCCGTFSEPMCAHEARNYHTKGYCNCHLTQENEIKVMSIVGSRKEMPLLQINSHQATLVSESTTLDGSFGNLKKKDHGVDSTLFCQDGRLLHSGCSEPPENMTAFNEAGLLTTYYPKKVEKLRNLEPGEVQPQTLRQHVVRTEDKSSDIFRRRYATPASALAGESLEKHLTNESWQPPVEKEDNGLQPHRQRHFITSSSSKPCEPEEHCVQKTVQKHRSKYDDPCRLLKQSRPKYFQPNNSLICKYVPCNQFEDYMKEKKPNCRKHSKPEKEQIQINSAIEKFMSEDNIDLSGLSTKIKKACSPKRVSFHDPDLAEINRLMISSKTSTPWKQQKNQSNQQTKLDLKKCSNIGKRNKGEKWFTNSRVLKSKRIYQSDLNRKIKGQNLKIKLNLHPFRKVRVHPEKSLSGLPKQCKQVLLPPKKLSKTSETKAKINTVSSADFLQQSESSNSVRLTSKRLPLKHASKQTPRYQRNTKHAPLFSANNLSVVNQSSIEDNHHSAGQIPDGNPSDVPQPPPIDAEHRHSHSQFSTEPMEGATQLESKVLGYLPTTWKNTENDVLPSKHSRGAIDQGTAESTEYMEQNVSKTSELNQLALSPRNLTQLLDVHETDNYKEYTLDQNEALQHREQNSSHAQLENKEKALMTKPQIPHKIVENCIMDKEENDVGRKLSKTETYDFSLIPQIQSKNNLSFMKTNSIPFQNRRELPEDISTSPVSSQTVWHLTKSGEKGIDSTSALPRDDGTEALEIKIVGKEEKNMLDESKTDSSMLIQITQMTLKGDTKERQQTWENGTSEKHVLYDVSSAEEIITAKDLSVTGSHETILCSEVDPEINSNMHNLREVQNIQQDKDSAHKESTMTMETHEALSLFPGLKDSFEEENEVLLVPSRINEAKNSAPKPVLYPPSAEYASTSPLEVE
uniref:Leucine rich repeat containing 53 n=2 Tax=Callithrix jacchus TaxID=9483 RepID=F7FKZ2_CALJA